MAKKKIKPDHELEQTKIKLLDQENKLGFLQNMIKANEAKIESLKAKSAVLIQSFEDTLISQRIHEVEYGERIKGLHEYMDKMLDLQQPKRHTKTVVKKTSKKKKKKKSKAEILAIVAEKKAEFDAEMERLKEEPEPEGDEESQIPTTI